MKNIETQTPFTDAPDSPLMTFAQILEIAVRDPGEKGCSPQELMLRDPIIKTLSAAEIGEEIPLSHEQWAKVNELFNARNWTTAECFREVAFALVDEMKVTAGATE